MIHPIPPGTRDVLPDEMRELRALTDRMRATYEDAGYGEVWTPVLEYEDVLRGGDERSAGAGYRLFDEHGEVLALRSDMTIPIARVVASRYADAQPPLRFSYFAHAYRDAGPGQPREFLQCGIELVGAAAPQGEAEVLALTIEALDAAGLRRHRVGIGDASLYRTLLEGLGVAQDDQTPLLDRLARRDLVGLEMRVAQLGLGQEAGRLLGAVPQVRGGPEVLDQAEVPLDGLRALHAQLEERGVAGRVIFDLGLVRELGYYTGTVFEVYDPAVGFALSGGGRYDELLGRFGRPLPACGMSLDAQRVHVAQAAEEGLG